MFHAIVQCCTFMLTKSIKDAASEILFELVVGGKILKDNDERTLQTFPKAKRTRELSFTYHSNFD